MSRTTKDRDRYQQVPSWFKRVMKRKRRAKVKDAIAKGRELPRFRPSDEWDWW